MTHSGDMPGLRLSFVCCCRNDKDACDHLSVESSAIAIDRSPRSYEGEKEDRRHVNRRATAVGPGATKTKHHREPQLPRHNYPGTPPQSDKPNPVVDLIPLPVNPPPTFEHSTQRRRRHRHLPALSLPFPSFCPYTSSHSALSSILHPILLLLLHPQPALPSHPVPHSPTIWCIGSLSLDCVSLTRRRPSFPALPVHPSWPRPPLRNGDSDLRHTVPRLDSDCSSNLHQSPTTPLPFPPPSP
jgi:hypothetical protein